MENFEEWKKFVEKAAEETLRKLEGKKFRFTVEFSSQEVKEEALKLLRERFGNDLRVVEA